MPSVFALRMRFGWVILGGAGLFAPAAQASSFVTIAPPTAKVSSSFVVLGEALPKPVEEAALDAKPKPRSSLDMPPDYGWEPAPLRISASIIAFGAPAVEPTKVASIGMPKPEVKAEVEPAPRPRPRPAPLPKVIRAGVKGHAFPDYVAQQPAALPPAPPPPSEPPPDQPNPKPSANQPPPAPRDPDPPVSLQ